MSCMSKPSMPALRRVEFINFNELHLWHRQDQHLRDAHAALDGETLWPEIDQRHLHFAAIVAVDGAGRVDHGDAEAARESSSGSNLCFVTMRNCHREAASDQANLSAPELDRPVDRGRKIEAGRVL